MIPHLFFYFGLVFFGSCCCASIPVLFSWRWEYLWSCGLSHQRLIPKLLGDNSYIQRRIGIDIYRFL